MNNNSRRSSINLINFGQFDTAGLYALTEQLFPVKFVFGRQNKSDFNGLIVGGLEQHDGYQTVPTLNVSLSLQDANNIRSEEIEVEFAKEFEVPFPFRGRSLKTKVKHLSSIPSLKSNEKILASTSELGPVWTVLETNGVKHYRSAFTMPDFSSEQNFADVFNGESFLEMLVLMEFIRSLNPETIYEIAPLRASFIIDDPNLHWPRYGYFDYREMVNISKQENFHMSFATIPLDNWYTHMPTADIFRDNQQRISLLIHGNNHAKNELGIKYSDENRKYLLLEAIDRIVKLEKKSNLHISRVMVPPHGACSNDMLAAMPSCGFESACISSGSLRFHNPERMWVKTLGFYPSEFIEGCPVLPRWGLTGNVENTLLLAAYLGQPLIVRGHHQDLKGGGGKFIDYARFINSLGDVLWLNMTDISRLNYQWRMESTTIWIKPYGQKLIFKFPESVTEICIESLPGKFSVDYWQIKTATNDVYNIKSGERFAINCLKGTEISLECKPTVDSLQKVSNFKSTPIKLLLRRLLTELRDRMLIS